MLIKFYSYTFGCRVNQAETLGIRNELLGIGFIENKENPEFVIINSCSVTQKADKEVRQLIRSIKLKNPKTRVVLMGCGATKIDKDKITIPEVDLVITNKDKDKVAEIIIKKLGKLGSLGRLEKSEGKNQNIFGESGRYLLKIQDGCNQFCTYCIVPYLRGQSKSKKTEDILGEIKENNRNKEIILTGINTDLYGKDTGETLSGLVEKILEETEIERLSFGSINPKSVDGKLLSLMSSSRLIKYFHIPIQSGSDRILGLMNRNYKIKEIKGVLEKINNIQPLINLGTDIIVGFPGESEQDFLETYKFLKDSPISKIHIFRYSKREGTAAVILAKKLGEVSETEKKKRAGMLADLGEKKQKEFMKRHLGKQFSALFLVRKKDGYREVLLDNQVNAYIKENNIKPGSINDVKIEKYTEGKLYGVAL